MQYDMSAIAHLAQSSAGQQLIAYLQKNGGEKLQRAVAQASAGNLEEAKQTMSGILGSAEAQKLLQQLEEGR